MKAEDIKHNENYILRKTKGDCEFIKSYRAQQQDLAFKVQSRMREFFQSEHGTTIIEDVGVISYMLTLIENKPDVQNLVFEALSECLGFHDRLPPSTVEKIQSALRGLA